MNLNKVIGYFVDRDGDKTKASDVFVAIDVVENNHGDRLIYCPIGQHSCASLNYMNEDCERITLEEYKKASEGFYTPEIYLDETTLRDDFEKISLDVAYAFDCDQDEVMEAFDEGRVVQFSSMDEAFKYMFIEDGGRVEYKQVMLDMAKITKEDLDASECDSVGQYALLTFTETKYVDENLYVFIYE